MLLIVKQTNQKEKWHRILGHVNCSYLNTLYKEQLLTVIPMELETEFMKYKTYIENKTHNLSFKNSRTRAEDILEIVGTDICGNFTTTGINGEMYFVSFIEDYSKIAKIYCIKPKAVFDYVFQFVNESENLTAKRVKF
jgi:hypothetical protein